MGSIINEDTIVIDDDIVYECIRELDTGIDDRKEFFNKCVFERLKQCNEQYEADLGIEFDRIIKSIDNMPIDDLMKSIKKLTRYCSNNLYKYEMVLFDILEE